MTSWRFFSLDDNCSNISGGTLLAQSGKSNSSSESLSKHEVTSPPCPIPSNDVLRLSKLLFHSKVKVINIVNQIIRKNYFVDKLEFEELSECANENGISCSTSLK
jgi:hypothetical protein